jgi:hypothetical protein
MRRDAVFVVCGVARSCDLEAPSERIYVRSHVYAIGLGSQIVYMCDRMFVRLRTPGGAGVLWSDTLFGQIAPSCDHRHGLYDDSCYIHF